MILHGGPVKGAATMDLNQQPPRYAVKGNLDGVDAGGLLDANLDLGDMLTGKLSGNLELAASGETPAEVISAAKGSGAIAMADGSVGAINVLAILSDVSGLLGEQSLEQVSGRLATEGTPFSTLAATFAVSKGKVKSSDLRLMSSDFDLTGSGSLDMLEATLEIEGSLTFSEKVSAAMVAEKSKAADYFWDQNRRRVSLPLTMAGPIDAPVPNVDWNAAAGQLARSRLDQELEEKGISALLKGSRAPGGSLESLAGSLPPETTPGQTGGLDVSIRRGEFSGNFLTPDLKIRGTLSGRNITAARLEVIDRSGKALYEKSLIKQVREFYQTADPNAAASIDFKIDVDGKDIASAGGQALFTITLEDAEGHRALRRFEATR